jgi:hypothetical protein
MSDISRCASKSSSIHSNVSNTCTDSSTNHQSCHPLSTESDHLITTVELSMTTHVDSTRRKPASIRSIQRDVPMPGHRKTQSSVTPSMFRTNSNGGHKTPNERNLIFDEWVTSKAHPALAAHSLIPSDIVDDDRAVQNMLA